MYCIKFDATPLFLWVQKLFTFLNLLKNDQYESTFLFCISNQGYNYQKLSQQFEGSKKAMPCKFSQIFRPKRNFENRTIRSMRLVGAAKGRTLKSTQPVYFYIKFFFINDTNFQQYMKEENFVMNLIIPLIYIFLSGR